MEEEEWIGEDPSEWTVNAAPIRAEDLERAVAAERARCLQIVNHALEATLAAEGCTDDERIGAEVTCSDIYNAIFAGTDPEHSEPATEPATTP